MLTDLTIVDFSTQGPGPRSTRLLADYGARLIKVRPTNARNRLLEPPPYSYSGDRDVERIRIDLKDPAGQAAARDLVCLADVVVESFRPGRASRLGIGYEDLSKVRPGLVYCSVSGYGQTGPYADRPGHDLNYLGIAGYVDVTGRTAEGVSALPGATVADGAGGLCAALAVLAAVVRSRSTGEGAYLDVSVTEAAIRMTGLFLDEHLATGADISPGGHRLTGGLACYDVYAAGDGQITVAALEPHFWRRLCELLALPDHLLTRQRDPEAQPEIRALLRERFRTGSRRHWVDLLGAECCVGPVHTVAEVFADPQLRGRGLTWQVPRANGARVEQLAPNLAGGPSSPRPGTVLRDKSETDTAALLSEAGLLDRDIETLRSAGVVE
ncbi:CoA transferase [Acrocarpospora macrocephala]|uniref:CoA transferase n=1 Tax=Acrocarpospora macrocephala TaxID=150177 RepID=A0A5M3WN82_9ACTN|nr:CaiB/BaiF CoA-transferase family protein [Acrocarpospora macrocephala]GES09619.1 CoA transferase [Acrocarpospora macrocephala]